MIGVEQSFLRHLLSAWCMGTILIPGIFAVERRQHNFPLQKKGLRRLFLLVLMTVITMTLVVDI